MQYTWADTEAALARAFVVDRLAPPPLQLSAHTSPRTHSGCTVYRNNIRVSLVDVLRTGFPVTAQLVGEDFFSAMAGEFVASNLPASPVLIEYGNELPAFIARFEPAQDVPYLADVAALESAWNESYHAAEGTSLNGNSIRDLSPQDVALAKVELHPSVQLIRSSFPIASIWSAHQSPGASLATIQWSAEDVLIIRPNAEVRVFVLKPASWIFMKNLQEAHSIEQSAANVAAAFPTFDPGSALLELFNAGAIVAFVRGAHVTSK